MLAESKPAKKQLFTVLNVALLRDFSATIQKEFRVIPIIKDNKIFWFDVAGYPLAVCTNEGHMVIDNKENDYHLNSQKSIVYVKKYLKDFN